MPGSYEQTEAAERTRADVPSATDGPEVRLGELLPGGLAPAILGIVDRGVRRRPEPARTLRAEVELTIEDGYPPVRIHFGEHEVLVEDGPGQRPDARIQGSLTDLIALMVSPAVGGVPLPVNSRGRAALGIMVSRRVKIEGSMTLVRRVLGVIRV